MHRNKNGHTSFTIYLQQIQCLELHQNTNIDLNISMRCNVYVILHDFGIHMELINLI